MRFDRRTLALASIACALLIACTLSGADETLPPHPDRAEFCKQNPEKCEEARAKREAFCRKTPRPAHR